MVYTYDYNRDYSPSAPFVEIVLNNELEDAIPIELSAQVDSGADASLVPIALLQRVAAGYEFRRRMVTADGRGQTVDLYSVAIKLAGRTFYRTVVSVEQGDEVIIGRDILNHLVVTLDGFATTTLIQAD